MNKPFEITVGDIVALTDVQLTRLLQRLLYLDVEKLGIAKRHVSVSLQIDIPDGGQDGRLEWEGGPDPSGSNWIPRRLNVFQVKATKMGPQGCGNEILKKGALKPRVQDVIKGSGAYILFYGHPCEGNMVNRRIAQIRKTMTTIADKQSVDAVSIQIYGAEKIAEWANEYAAAITAVFEMRGLALPASFQSWESWNQEQSSNLQFHLDAPRSDILKELRELALSPGKTMRLVGLSGLGKSRLALEVFRPPINRHLEPLQQCLSEICMYLGNGADFKRDAEETVRSLRQRGKSAAIIVDECPIDLHETLEKIVSAPESKISLVTLDFDPNSRPSGRHCMFHSLRPMGPEDMGRLLGASRSYLSPENFDAVVRFVQGFPRMADLLIDAMRQNRVELWKLGNLETYRKLVIRRSTSAEQTWRVARVFAVFEHIGTENDVVHERRLIGEHLLSEYKPHQIHESLKELESAGIADRRGDYVRVTPLPLALALAADWWDGCSPELAETILTGDTFTNKMQDAAQNQLSLLRGYSVVEQVIGKLIGPTSPFSQRELPLSARGSRLLSSLAEVNPRAVCDRLLSLLSNLSVKDALEIREGRRDLVHCLEKLAWSSETFEDAAWLLLILGAGETEHWANNASETFKRLFHLRLSGTELPAIKRLPVIARALKASSDDRIKRLAISSLCASFTVDFLGSRESGSLSSSPSRQDWTPEDGDVVKKYWMEVVGLLIPYLTHAELGQESRRTVARYVRGMLFWDGLESIEAMVGAVATNDTQWFEMLDALREALQRDRIGHDTESRLRIDLLIGRLNPRDLADRLKLCVTSSGRLDIVRMDRLQDELGDGKDDRALEQLKQLAQEVLSDQDNFKLHLDRLQRGQQRQGFVFGQILAELTPDQLGLLTSAMTALQELPDGQRNTLLLMGMANKIEQKDRQGLRTRLYLWLRERDSAEAATDMLRVSRIDDADIEEILAVLPTGSLPSNVLEQFVYGRALQGVTLHLVAKFLDALSFRPNGAKVALEILGMQLPEPVHSADGEVIRAPVPEEFVPITRRLLLLPQVIAEEEVGADMRRHHFESLSLSLLQHSQVEPEFKCALLRLLLKEMRQSFGDPVHVVIHELLKCHTKDIWSEFCARLLDAGGFNVWALTLTLGQEKPSAESEAPKSRTKEPFDFVELVGEDRLLEWCEEAGAEAQGWVATMIKPLRPPKDGDPYPRWSQTAQALLARYGSNQSVLERFSVGIHSGTWAGSAIPRLTSHRDAFLELKRHPNDAVSSWATSEVHYLDRTIKSEQKREEEREFGIFR